MARSDNLALARTLAVNALVMFEIFYLWSARTLWAIGLVVLLQLVFSYWSASQGLFGLAPLSAPHWLLMLLVTSPILLLVELEKVLIRHFASRRHASV